MQCASCQFENMPGITVCGRCGARLEFAATWIDVHPPRATAAIKRFRRWFPWYGPYYRVRDFFAELVQRRIPDLKAPTLASGVYLRMIVPGWPQMFMGQTARGRCLLGLYLGLMLLGILSVGTNLGSILLGSALALHAASVIDILWSGTRDFRTRVSYALICLAALGTVVYFPVTWAVTRVAVPRRLTMDAMPLLAGDVFLYNPSAYWRSDPAPGDVVLYRLTPYQVDGAVNGRHAVFRYGGERIDRLLAGPGQSVKWENGQLWVEGQPSPWLPLNPDGVPLKLEFTVPNGCYLVLPSTVPRTAAAYPPQIWAGVSLVPRGNVLGRVFLRHQPLTRWWWVR